MEAYAFVRSTGYPTQNELGLTVRIRGAYAASVRLDLGAEEGMWLQGQIPDLKRDAHDRLLHDDIAVAAALLADPGESDLLFGFEDNARSLRLDKNETARRDLALGPLRQLILLSQALGLMRIETRLGDLASLPDLEAMLCRLDGAVGHRMEFPNPFPGEEGLETSRGICTYRATQAIYQALRLRQLVSHVRRPRILEIGAGSGRTAFYAHRMGIVDYTIIDLPLTGAASANHLARTLGQDAVSLFGEKERGRVRILPPASLQNSKERYHVVLNADSLTEMAESTARTYVDFADRHADYLLSINHERNPFTVADLCAGRPRQRYPSWMRDGYVEETIETKRHIRRKRLMLRTI